VFIADSAAIVTRIGAGAISISLFPPDNKGCLPKDGVRHASDPELARIISNSGVWDYTDAGKRLRVLEAELADRLDDGK
jgi:hypothetical protein